jgi:hypothetical protein
VHVPVSNAVKVEPEIKHCKSPIATLYVTCPEPSTPEVDNAVVECTANVEAAADTVIGCGVKATVKMTAVEAAV